jgi:uncharacterized membrane protein YfcA
MIRILGILVLVVIVVAMFNSKPTTKVASAPVPQTAADVARAQQQKQALDYIRRTSKTPGEAYRRAASEGFWTGFADGLAGK